MIWHLAHNIRSRYEVPRSRQTGIKVSPFALGALALGTSIGNPDPGDSARIIHKALYGRRISGAWLVHGSLLTLNPPATVRDRTERGGGRDAATAR